MTPESAAGREADPRKRQVRSLRFVSFEAVRLPSAKAARRVMFRATADAEEEAEEEEPSLVVVVVLFSYCDMTARSDQ